MPSTPLQCIPTIRNNIGVQNGIKSSLLKQLGCLPFSESLLRKNCAMVVVPNTTKNRLSTKITSPKSHNELTPFQMYTCFVGGNRVHISPWDKEKGHIPDSSVEDAWTLARKNKSHSQNAKPAVSMSVQSDRHNNRSLTDGLSSINSHLTLDPLKIPYLSENDPLQSNITSIASRGNILLVSYGQTIVKYEFSVPKLKKNEMTSSTPEAYLIVNNPPIVLSAPKKVSNATIINFKNFHIQGNHTDKGLSILANPIIIDIDLSSDGKYAIGLIGGTIEDPLKNVYLSLEIAIWSFEAPVPMEVFPLCICPYNPKSAENNSGGELPSITCMVNSHPTLETVFAVSVTTSSNLPGWVWKRSNLAGTKSKKKKKNEFSSKTDTSADQKPSSSASKNDPDSKDQLQSSNSLREGKKPFHTVFRIFTFRQSKYRGREIAKLTLVGQPQKVLSPEIKQKRITCFDWISCPHEPYLIEKAKSGAFADIPDKLGLSGMAIGYDDSTICIISQLELFQKDQGSKLYQEGDDTASITSDNPLPQDVEQNDLHNLSPTDTIETSAIRNVRQEENIPIWSILDPPPRKKHKVDPVTNLCVFHDGAGINCLIFSTKRDKSFHMYAPRSFELSDEFSDRFTLLSSENLSVECKNSAKKSLDLDYIRSYRPAEMQYDIWSTIPEILSNLNKSKTNVENDNSSLPESTKTSSGEQTLKAAKHTTPSNNPIKSKSNHLNDPLYCIVGMKPLKLTLPYSSNNASEIPLSQLIAFTPCPISMVLVKRVNRSVLTTIFSYSDLMKSSHIQDKDSFRSTIFGSTKQSFHNISLQSHNGIVTGLSSSSPYRPGLLVSCSTDGVVNIWELCEKENKGGIETLFDVENSNHQGMNGKCLKIIVHHKCDFQCLSCALHPLGTMVAIGFIDHISLFVITIGGLKICATWPIRRAVETKFSNSGNYLAVGSGTDVYLIGIPNQKIVRILRGHQRRVQSISWNSLDTQLATCGRDGATYIWKIDNSDQVATEEELEALELFKNKSQDTSTVSSAYGNNKFPIEALERLSTSKRSAEYVERNIAVLSACWTKCISENNDDEIFTKQGVVCSENLLFVGTDKLCKIIDQGRCIKVLEQGGKFITNLAILNFLDGIDAQNTSIGTKLQDSFAQKTRQILFAGTQDGSVLGFQLPLPSDSKTLGQPLFLFEKIHTGSISRLSVSSDGRYLFSACSRGNIIVFDLKTSSFPKTGKSSPSSSKSKPKSVSSIKDSKIKKSSPLSGNSIVSKPSNPAGKVGKSLPLLDSDKTIQVGLISDQFIQKMEQTVNEAIETIVQLNLQADYQNRVLSLKHAQTIASIEMKHQNQIKILNKDYQQVIDNQAKSEQLGREREEKLKLYQAYRINKIQKQLEKSENDHATFVNLSENRYSELENTLKQSNLDNQLMSMKIRIGALFKYQFLKTNASKHVQELTKSIEALRSEFKTWKSMYEVDTDEEIQMIRNRNTKTIESLTQKLLLCQGKLDRSMKNLDQAKQENDHLLKTTANLSKKAAELEKTKAQLSSELIAKKQTIDTQEKQKAKLEEQNKDAETRILQLLKKHTNTDIKMTSLAKQMDSKGHEILSLEDRVEGAKGELVYSKQAQGELYRKLQATKKQLHDSRKQNKSLTRNVEKLVSFRESLEFELYHMIQSINDPDIIKRKVKHLYKTMKGSDSNEILDVDSSNQQGSPSRNEISNSSSSSSRAERVYSSSSTSSNNPTSSSGPVQSVERPLATAPAKNQQVGAVKQTSYHLDTNYAAQELRRQRDYLERRVSQLKQHIETSKQKYHSSNYKLLKQNKVLIQKLTELGIDLDL